MVIGRGWSFTNCLSVGHERRLSHDPLGCNGFKQIFTLCPHLQPAKQQGCTRSPVQPRNQPFSKEHCQSLLRYRHRPTPGAPAWKPTLAWNQWRDHERWTDLDFNYEKGKGGAEVRKEKKKTPRACCPPRAQQGSPQSSVGAEELLTIPWRALAWQGMSAGHCALSLSLTGISAITWKSASLG